MSRILKFQTPKVSGGKLTGVKAGAEVDMKFQTPKVSGGKLTLPVPNGLSSLGKAGQFP